MHTIILGKDAEYLPDGLVARPRGHLILKDGTHYTFDVIDMPYYTCDAPDRNSNLIEVERLAYGAGKWMLGSESFFESLADIQFQAWLQLNRYQAEQSFPPIPWDVFQETVRESSQLWFPGQEREREAEIVLQINGRFFEARYVRHWGLARVLREEQNETLQREVCAAAWFEGNDTPVLLRDFSEIKSRQTAEVEDKLRKTEEKLERAEQAASLTLEEALAKWLRFEPPGMKANTQARIEKAVKLYSSDPGKRSLAKIAAEFRVTRKTVSTWFAKFTRETSFLVVRHTRHESVKAHLRAEGSPRQGGLAGGSGAKTPRRTSK